MTMMMLKEQKRRGNGREDEMKSKKSFLHFLSFVSTHTMEPNTQYYITNEIRIPWDAFSENERRDRESKRHKRDDDYKFLDGSIRRIKETQSQDTYNDISVVAKRTGGKKKKKKDV